jgi:hypothetical protein
MDSDQILNTEAGSAGRCEDERVRGSQTGPAGRQKAHAPVLVAVVHTFFAPLPPLGRHLQRPPTQRMEGMGYAETWSRIASLRCI